MKTVPYLHQQKEFDLHRSAEYRGLLWTPQRGKTKAVIDNFCWLYQQGEIDTVIVVAQHGTYRNWINRELPIHHWDDVPYRSWAWTAATKTQGFKEAYAWNEGLGWFAFSSANIARADLMPILKRLVFRRKAAIVFDETTDFRTPGSKRTMRARAIAKHCKYRRILTGTLVDGSALHAYPQFELLKPGLLGYTRYSDFKSRYAIYQNRETQAGHVYPQLIGYQNLDELKERMAPHVSVLTPEDCPDMPEMVVTRRPVEMSKDQSAVYDDIKEDIVAEIEGSGVSIGEAAPKFIKLQQVTSGFLRDEDGDDHVVTKVNPKIEALKEEVLMTGGRVIVWAQFKRDLDAVTEALRNIGREVVECRGGMKDRDKMASIAAMAPETGQEGPDFVGQPQSGGYGLNLSAAVKIIWYSHVWDSILRIQANGRLSSKKGGNISIVDIYVPGTIDEKILTAYDNKHSVAEELSRSGIKALLQEI